MSGKRQAASPPADEPEPKQAKGDDADAKATADAETAGATEAGGDDPMETEENGTGGRGARRSMRTRNPVRKASTRNEGKGAKGPAGACAISPTHPTPTHCFPRSDVAHSCGWDENDVPEPPARAPARLPARPPARRRDHPDPRRCRRSDLAD